MSNPHPVNGFDKRPEDINLNGRPKKEWTWAGVLREVAEQEFDSRDGKKEGKKLAAQALFKEVLKGNVPAIKEFGDRIDGKAKQALEVSGEDGGPVRFLTEIHAINSSQVPAPASSEDDQ